MTNQKKRKTENHGGEGSSKKKKFFQKNAGQSKNGIEAGMQGIFATCDLKKEPRSVMELYPLLQETAKELYNVDDDYIKKPDNEDDDDEDDDEDIEKAIASEIAGMKNVKSKEERLFNSIRLDTPCVVFFRTKPPIVPTEVVEKICENAMTKGQKTTRVTQRLTPITRTGRANYEDLVNVAKEVLAPHFHEGQEGVKFAIRPTIRNHNQMNRDGIIRAVASVVGQKHKVDLKKYDVLILVEVLKNICGISVVRDFEKYKRFSLVQIHESVMKERTDSKDEIDKDVKVETEATSSSSIDIKDGPENHSKRTNGEEDITTKAEDTQNTNQSNGDAVQPLKEGHDEVAKIEAMQ